MDDRTHDHHLTQPHGGGAACTAPFAHEALLYAGLEGFLQAIVPFVEEGLAAGEATMVAVAGDRLTGLRESLRGAGDDLLLVDMAEMGRNPSRIIGRWRDFVAERGGRGPLRGVGEPIWAGRTPQELVECQRHEWLINLAFAAVEEFRLICPYDVEALPEAVIAEAWRSHPVVLRAGAISPSATYAPPPAHLVPGDDLPPPPAAAETTAFDAASLGELRRAVRARATASGIAGERASDLLLAVSELATNSVLYGGGGGALTTWTEPGVFVCEVRDAGRLEDPLVGRARPSRTQHGGRGIWLVNEVCDLVQVRAIAAGTVVRLHMRIA